MQQNVSRLQARIVQATQANDWRRIRSLQRLLTRSFSARALAVRRVTENHGKNTPGIDGVLWNAPQKKTKAIPTLTSKAYTPSPLKRVYIPKKKGRRPLGIPTMRDRAMQALYLLALDPVAETQGDPNSYGFRRERSTADAIAQCVKVLQRDHCARWILEVDIHSCFDHLSHDWMMQCIPVEKQVLRKWLKAGFLHKKQFHPTAEGAPQGGIISPVLCNMTLDGLETLLRARFGQRNTAQANRAQVNLVRYADDFIITGRTKEILEHEVQPLVEKFLAERTLSISTEKTRITHIKDGFDFLGKNIRKYDKDAFLVKPSKSSVQRIQRRLKEIIKSNPQVKTGRLICLLNPVIRGWANYYRHDVSTKTFEKVDTFIFQVLWRWCKRRHPKKRGDWIKEKYFPRDGNRNWTFAGETEDGTRHRLCKMTDTSIKRHRKIKGEANPYDLKWQEYFDRRRNNLWMYENCHRMYNSRDDKEEEKDRETEFCKRNFQEA